MSAAAAQQAVKILQELSVSPPAGIVPATSLPLTFLDIGWLQGDSMKRAFFYNFPNFTSKYFVGEVLPKLTSSLSFALQHFFPFAGKVRLSPYSTDQYEIYYDSDAVAGIPFTVAETSELDFDYLVGDGDLDPSLLRQIVPSLHGGIENNLLAVQVTIFPGRGMSLGIAFNHLVCDGSGYVHFLKTWANACRSPTPAPPPPSPPPLFDRSLIPDPKGIYKIYLNVIREYAESHSKKMISVESPPDLVLATLTLSKEAIEKLKEKVRARSAATHCSTFVVACAYVWVCLVKSRNYNNEDEEVHFACAADARSGISPPVPENYFGNCLTLSVADVKTVGELTGEEGFIAAAEAIASGIKKFKEDPMRDIENMLTISARLMEKRPMTVAGSPKFRVYDVDFGWGSPEKTEVMSIIDTGAVSVAESKDKRGGIQIGVVCSRSEMEIFRSNFAAGL